MISSPTAVYDQLCQHIRSAAALKAAVDLLEWDERTLLPAAGGEYRAEQVTQLSGMIHDRWTDPRLGEWLAALADSPLAADRTSDTGATIYQIRRTYVRKVKLPKPLVEELARTRVLGQQAWIIARRQDDFNAFKPLLTKTIELKRQEAAALGFTDTAYDPLLDEFEPEARTVDVSRVLADLRSDLVPLVAEIASSSRRPKEEIIARHYPRDAQERFGRLAAERIGFEFERGRLDTTAHPFCTTLGPNDCRITTRYDERHFPGAFFGILHEAGHGIYEQGLPREQFGLPLGEAISLGIHESQSRLWENQVGRCRAFWDFFYSQAQAAFPSALADVAVDDFDFAINDVRPSLIRVEADEATYNLHILIRFELEQALIGGDLTVADLPAAWNDKYQQSLGIAPPSDADGVLQDIHWSAGLIGYFPTYSLGNLYAAQFAEQAESDLGGLAGMFRRGEFRPLREWLREKIHRHGRRYSAADLVEQVTGRPLSHRPLIEHLRRKFAPLYDLRA